jgi:hypothetical protein
MPNEAVVAVAGTRERYYRWLSSNVNHHLEHHLYPSVPYRALPELGRALTADYRAHQSNVQNGYGRAALVLLGDPGTSLPRKQSLMRRLMDMPERLDAPVRDR